MQFELYVSSHSNWKWIFVNRSSLLNKNIPNQASHK